MAASRCVPGWVGALVPLVLASHAALAAGVLFPVPLHLTREITDPVSGVTTVVDEYCHGNRIVSITEDRTAVADHGAGTVVVIDFRARTWSETPFRELAAVRETPRRPAASAWRVERRGVRAVGSRSGDTFEIERTSGDARETIRVTADRTVMLSRPAVEALLGIGYPNAGGEGEDPVIRALAADADGRGDRLRLPLEQVVRVESAGEVLESRNVVVRVGAELPPPVRMTPPPGARRVEARELAARDLLDELDRTPAAQR